MCSSPIQQNHQLTAILNKQFYLNVKKCKIKMFGSSTIMILLTFFSIISVSEAGTCWLKRMESGKCTQMFTKNVTRSSCCSAGPSLGYTDRDLSAEEAFFVEAFNDPVSCGPCMETCETTTCGPGKRCIMKRGKPKCVCAPLCKAPAKVSNKKVNMQKINVIAMQQNTKNLKRQSNLERRRPSNQRITKVLHSGNSRNKVESMQIVTFNDSDNFSLAKSDKLVLISAVGKNATIRHKHKKVADKLGGEWKKVNHGHRGHGTGNSSRWSKIKHFDGDNNVENQFRMGFFNEEYFPLSKKAPSINNRIHNINDVATPNHQTFNPVCGTDGKTYKTECQLKKRACRIENSLLTTAYRGHCQTSCRFVQCSNGKHCVEDQNSMPHCVICAKKCPDKSTSIKSLLQNPHSASKLVCGVDGVTYKNLCELKQAVCLLGRAIQVAYRGPCIEAASCENIKCKDKEVCLKDLSTHQPRCVSCSYKCPRQKQMLGDKVTEERICGMNNHTYHSWCHMIKDSCNTGLYIGVNHNGACKNKKVDKSSQSKPNLKN